jgi:hypothetical protein
VQRSVNKTRRCYKLARVKMSACSFCSCKSVEDIAMKDRWRFFSSITLFRCTGSLLVLEKNGKYAAAGVFVRFSVAVVLLLRRLIRAEKNRAELEVGRNRRGPNGTSQKQTESAWNRTENTANRLTGIIKPVVVLTTS